MNSSSNAILSSSPLSEIEDLKETLTVLSRHRAFVFDWSKKENIDRRCSEIETKISSLREERDSLKKVHKQSARLLEEIDQESKVIQGRLWSAIDRSKKVRKGDLDSRSKTFPKHVLLLAETFGLTASAVVEMLRGEGKK